VAVIHTDDRCAAATLMTLAVLWLGVLSWLALAVVPAWWDARARCDRNGGRLVAQPWPWQPVRCDR
jgi:hypothetical protein